MQRSPRDDLRLSTAISQSSQESHLISKLRNQITCKNPVVKNATLHTIDSALPYTEHMNKPRLATPSKVREASEQQLIVAIHQALSDYNFTPSDRDSAHDDPTQLPNLDHMGNDIEVAWGLTHKEMYADLVGRLSNLIRETSRLSQSPRHLDESTHNLIAAAHCCSLAR